MTLLFDHALQAHRSGKFSEAEDLYRKIVSDDPKNFDALHMLGIVCSGSGKLQDADEFFRAALSIDPGFPPCHVNYGFCLLKQKRLDEAVASFDKALVLFPNFAEAWFGRGNALRDLKRFDDALAAYSKALLLQPNLAEAHGAHANILAELGRYDDAIAAYDRALALNPYLEFVESERLHCKMRVCNWKNFSSEYQHLIAALRNKKTESQPFYFLGLSSSAKEQLECAKNWVAKKSPPSGQPMWKRETHKHDRIRIAYISADFREHPVAYLIAGLIESHRRETFEVIGIALQPEDPSQFGQRIKLAFEKFIDVSKMTDRQIAQLIRSLEIDIVVDLMGFTKNSRPTILAERPAPIQVNYLGFPGMMGASYIDYIIADRFVIPDAQRDFYSEKIIYLPGAFQANDSKRKIDSTPMSRAEVGLPQNAFVFCSFNNSYKINPICFDVWMRLLQQVQGSVLWLLGRDNNLERNLCREAENRGVNPDRLIFASRIPYANYLARYRLADLFLDTFPFNAGTTASDALWAGLPIITYSGEAFASRMAGSLLTAVGLPEMITQTQQEYENLAAELATDPEKLAAIKETLSQNRLRLPLFNTQLFTAHIESAYQTMYERYQAGLSADHIYVAQ